MSLAGVREGHERPGLSLVRGSAMLGAGLEMEIKTYYTKKCWKSDKKILCGKWYQSEQNCYFFHLVHLLKQLVLEPLHPPHVLVSRLLKF